MLLAVVGAVVLVSRGARGAASGARPRLAARAELLRHAPRCNTHIAHILPPRPALRHVASNRCFVDLDTLNVDGL